MYNYFFVASDGEFNPERLNQRCDAKHFSVAIETDVRQKDVAVWIESEEVAEGLDGNDCAGDGISFRH